MSTPTVAQAEQQLRDALTTYYRILGATETAAAAWQVVEVAALLEHLGAQLWQDAVGRHNYLEQRAEAHVELPSAWRKYAVVEGGKA